MLKLNLDQKQIVEFTNDKVPIAGVASIVLGTFGYVFGATGHTEIANAVMTADAIILIGGGGMWAVNEYIRSKYSSSHKRHRK